ncbi:OstA-like protein [Myroides sp. LJL119]
MRALHYTILFSLLSLISFSQIKDSKKIIIHHADFSDINQNILPDAVILTGNVSAEHDGMTMTCDKAYYFENENYLKLFGNVHVVQQDTLSMDSKYAEYNAANGFAYAQGEVVLSSPDSTLETDTLKFDRNRNLLFYDSYGKITNKNNVLTSNNGRYYTDQKKFQFLNGVVITTENGTKVESNHLDYYEQPEHAYLIGPSTVTNQENVIYTENGFYDIQNDIAKLLKNSHIWHEKRKIEADSIYYDRNKEFASASYFVKITDTINKAIINSHYAEVYQAIDSVYVTNKPLVSKQDQQGNTMYLYAPVITLSGPEKNRLIRAYHGARILRDSMSGKADSITSNESNGITQLLGKPVVWSGENQLSGNLIELLTNTETQKLDSLKVLQDAFVIEKDTIGQGYNQLKGVNLYGSFLDGKLKEIDLIKNTEMIYYLYNDNQELVGIDKGICSHINISFEDGQIASATKFVDPDSELYPDKDLPVNARNLRGFNWRGDEKINSLQEIFPQQELDNEKLLLQEIKQKRLLYGLPMPLEQSTLDTNAELQNLKDAQESQQESQWEKPSLDPVNDPLQDQSHPFELDPMEKNSIEILEIQEQEKMQNPDSFDLETSNLKNPIQPDSQGKEVKTKRKNKAKSKSKKKNQ